MQHDASFLAGLDVFPASDQPQEEQARSTAQRAPVTGVGPDGTNRRMLDLPPVVNGRLQYANKHVKYTPFPSDLDEIRDKLFKVEQPILLDGQQIADYWLHMSNVYQRSTKPSLEQNGTVVESWECRNRRRVTNNERPRPSMGIRNRAHKRDMMLQDIPQCKVRIKITTYTKHAEGQDPPCPIGIWNCKCLPEWMYIARTIQTENQDFEHSHPISLCDQMKRTNALMYFCKLKVEEHYKVRSVYHWVREKYLPTAKELEFLTYQDVTNVTKFWRMANPDVELRAEIEDDGPDRRQQEECIEAIEATSEKRLRQALMEVLARIPEAVHIVRPFMETPTNVDQDHSKIAEGENITIPPPGLPTRKYRPPDADTAPPTNPLPPQIPRALPLAPHPPVQMNGQPVPPGAHPLHVPAHLVPQYISNQAHPPPATPPFQTLPQIPSLSQPSQPVSSDPNVTSRDFITAASAVTQYRAPYGKPLPHLPPSSDHSSVRHMVIHGFAPLPPPQTNGAYDSRPSWATPPNKRSRDAVSTASVPPPKRPNTTEDIDMQLQRELQT